MKENIVTKICPKTFARNFEFEGLRKAVFLIKTLYLGESGAVVARLTPDRKVGGSNPAAAKTVTREEIHSR